MNFYGLERRRCRRRHNMIRVNTRIRIRNISKHIANICGHHKIPVRPHFSSYS